MAAVVRTAYGGATTTLSDPLMIIPTTLIVIDAPTGIHSKRRFASNSPTSSACCRTDRKSPVRSSSRRVEAFLPYLFIWSFGEKCFCLVLLLSYYYGSATTVNTMHVAIYNGQQEASWFIKNAIYTYIYTYI